VVTAVAVAVAVIVTVTAVIVIVIVGMMILRAIPTVGMMLRVIAVAKAKVAPLVKVRVDPEQPPMAKARVQAARVGHKVAGRLGPKRAFQTLNWAD
jgi:hypothetical protein